MDFLKNKTITLLALLGGALSLLAGYYLSAPIFLGISALCFLLSIIIWKFGYFLAPLLTRTINYSPKFDDYELTPQQDVILKKSSDGYYASAFLSVSLRDSTAFKTSEQKSALMEMFERAISSLRHTMKISLIVCNLDLSDYIDKLEERRSLAEHRRAQTKKNSSDFSRLDREIQFYSSQIKRLTSGEKPMQVLAYVQTTAFGLTREEVVSRIRSQAKESAAVLSNALSCQITPLVGEELLKCFQWEKFAPVSRADIENQLF
ncbi:MAG: hypothetical protein ABIH83_03490 [Candidatus Micrarchaeota archaeon]